MKKFIFCLFLIASLSMTSKISSLALPEATVVSETSYTWQKSNNEWSLVDKQGKTLSGFVSYENNIYYLNKNGIMKTGWTKISGSWYYFAEDTGILATDKWIDNYYVDANGKQTKTK